MKRLTTLTGKNLPRLAVAKPGWPTIHRDGLNRQARNPDELPDAGPKVENAQAFQEGITGGHSHLRHILAIPATAHSVGRGRPPKAGDP